MLLFEFRGRVKIIKSRRSANSTHARPDTIRQTGKFPATPIQAQKKKEKNLSDDDDADVSNIPKDKTGHGWGRTTAADVLVESGTERIAAAIIIITRGVI